MDSPYKTSLLRSIPWEDLLGFCFYTLDGLLTKILPPEPSSGFGEQKVSIPRGSRVISYQGEPDTGLRRSKIKF
ncbi:hypothetical protein [Anthocerotibacter panamensis]|uniref:hypothetical protein n=1 Tax=Anthocerotibacter panamensis TaxID=2857077 RepID=UPI001C4021A3|nr:hypothetical protein [Anthocerotibacter panamensis]